MRRSYPEAPNKPTLVNPSMQMAAAFLCALNLGLALAIFAAEQADKRLQWLRTNNWLDEDDPDEP